ncbi:ARR3 [Candida margitis]|uniref:ARR3 n=1 Tax=Candida margitis TaxID=1775924 RepID=UPI0022274705|nr:ARR3 [Candida margitis]KAI5952120.1 ARR3 [Candida margitis]
MATTSFKRDFTLVLKEMSLLDKLLPILIILSIVVGIIISVYVPQAQSVFNNISDNKLTTVSIPLTIGLIIMMIPPLCKIEYEQVLATKSNNKRSLYISQHWREIVISLFINWVVGPLLMFGLAWATLFNEKEYRTGIIMIGMARCIAMVLIWNQLALGSNDLCAILVLINSVLQIVLYAPYQILLCYVITGESIDFANNLNIDSLFVLVLKNIGVFLGIPLASGALIRAIALLTIGKEKFNTKVLPWINPWALIGLLYTIIVIFISKSDSFLHEIGASLKCFIPLCLYFIIMWFGTFFGFRYYSNYTNYGKLVREYEKSTVDDMTNTRATTGDEEEELNESTKLLVKCGCEEKLTPQQQEQHGRGKLQCNADYSSTVTQAFTASSNNFELSLAIAIALYGEGSKQAIAAVYGPLLEVPILLLLTFVARYYRFKLVWSDC